MQILLFVLILVFIFIMQKILITGNFTIENLSDTSFNYSKYKELLAKMESSNNTKDNPNDSAYGKYQFLPSTLNSLQNKYKLPEWINEQNFISNLSLQEIYIDALIKDSLQYYNSNLKQFDNKPVTGSIRFKNISTLSNVYGQIAAIHLSGAGNVKKFWLSNGVHDPNDGRTSLSDYLTYFSFNLKD